MNIRIPLALLALAACASEPPAPPVNGTKAARELALDSIPIRTWGEAEGMQLSVVSGMAFVGEDRVVVADGTAGTVTLLSLGDDTARRLGRTGSGPGEYRRPEVLGTTDDGRIMMRDMQQFRIIAWNADGSLHGTTGPGAKREGVIWSPAAVTGSGTLVTTAAAYGVPGVAGSLRRIEATVVIADEAGRAITPLGSFPYADFISLYLPGDGGQMIQGPQYFGWKLHVAAARDVIAVGSADRAVISMFRANGDSIGRIQLPTDRLAVTPAMRDAFIARARAQAQDRITPVSLAPERFADSLPYFGALVVTRGGTVWVVAPFWAGHSPPTMTGYTLAGERRGTLALPRHFMPLAATDSLVAGYLLDENEVPTIAVYRFR